MCRAKLCVLCCTDSKRVSEVSYSWVRCATVEWGALQLSEVRYSWVRCATVEWGALELSEVRYSWVRCATGALDALKATALERLWKQRMQGTLESPAIPLILSVNLRKNPLICIFGWRSIDSAFSRKTGNLNFFDRSGSNKFDMHFWLHFRKSTGRQRDSNRLDVSTRLTFLVSRSWDAIVGGPPCAQKETFRDTLEISSSWFPEARTW